MSDTVAEVQRACAKFVPVGRRRGLAPATRRSLGNVPRPLRHFQEGLYHVSAKGSDNRYLFLGDRSRAGFLDRLAAACRRFELRLASYVLMGSHYHMVVRIADARLSGALQQLHTAHSRDLNRTHGRAAHLFQAHCLARRIEDGDDLLTVLRYVALNPVAAALVDDPFAWAWSSARVHAGLAPAAIPLDESSIRVAFDDDPEWRLRYRRWLEATPLEPVSDTASEAFRLRRDMDPLLEDVDGASGDHQE